MVWFIFEQKRTLQLKKTRQVKNLANDVPAVAVKHQWVSISPQTSFIVIVNFILLKKQWNVFYLNLNWIKVKLKQKHELDTQLS